MGALREGWVRAGIRELVLVLFCVIGTSAYTSAYLISDKNYKYVDVTPRLVCVYVNEDI